MNRNVIARALVVPVALVSLLALPAISSAATKTPATIAVELQQNRVEFNKRQEANAAQYNAELRAARDAYNSAYHNALLLHSPADLQAARLGLLHATAAARTAYFQRLGANRAWFVQANWEVLNN